MASPLFLLVVLFSGFSALVYQIVWIRELSLLFGTHLLATSSVLTIFMAGLAFGAYIFGKLSDRSKKPVHLLAVLQASMAAVGFLFPGLFDLLLKSHGFLSIPEQSIWINPDLLRFLFAALILIIPCLIIGGTLPVMIRIYTHEIGVVGKKAGTVYSLNNLGAFLGGFLTGFFLIRLIGTDLTNYSASALNVSNVFILLFLSRNLPPIPKGDSAGHSGARQQDGQAINTENYSPLLIKLVLTATALEGFTMLVYEVLWTRILLEFSYDKTSYVYTTIILGFLSGLSLGAWLVRKKIDRWKNLPGKFTILEASIGFFSLLSFMLFTYLSPHFFSQNSNVQSWFSVSGKQYVFFFVLTLFPSLLMGISFPLAGKIITRDAKKIGSKMGILSFTDTIGSVFGPFITGFFLLRYLNIYQIFIISVLINLLSAAVLLLFLPGFTKQMRSGTIFTAVVAISLILNFFPSRIWFETKQHLYAGDEILDIEEGATATVAVLELPSDHRALAVNGAKTAFSNTGDMRVHKMLAYLPWFFCYEAENAVVIGYGMGVTARSLADQGIKTEIAEISPEVVRLSDQYFRHLNGKASEKENVDLFLEDGRSFLLKAGQKFDIITTNAVHPRLGANLYSRDFYRLCDSRMSDSSVICQWLPTNWMSVTEFKSLIKAFTEVFPYSKMWYANRSHTLLAGSRKELNIHFSRFDSLLHRPDIYRELIDVDISGTPELLAGFIKNGAEMHDFAGGIPPDTDRRPFIEYSFVTDLRPNAEILKWLKDPNPDPAGMIRFPSQMPPERRENTVARIEQFQELHRNYLNNLIQEFSLTDKMERPPGRGHRK